MTVRYGITIDNGTSYSAALPDRFDTEEKAKAFGESWLSQFYLDNSIAPEDQEDDEAGFDVFKEEVPGDEAVEQYDPMRDGWVDRRGRP